MQSQPATPQHALPMLAPAQSRKHLTVNEALQRIDARLFLRADAEADNLPGRPPEPGERVRLATGEIAFERSDAWQVVAPETGWLLWSAEAMRLDAYDGADWVPVGASDEVEALSAQLSSGGIEGIGIGAVPDAVNRLAVRSPAVLFDNEGGDQRLVLNKAGDADVASVVFQSAYAGHAEFGLGAGNAFTLRVSSDGQSFSDALSVDPDDGTLDIARPSLPSGSDMMVVGADHEVSLGTQRPIELYYLSLPQGQSVGEVHNIAGGRTGQILILQIPGSSIDVFMRDRVGNLRLKGDFSMLRPFDILTLFKRGGFWYEMSRSDG